MSRPSRLESVGRDHADMLPHLADGKSTGGLRWPTRLVTTDDDQRLGQLNLPRRRRDRRGVAESRNRGLEIITGHWGNQNGLAIRRLGARGTKELYSLMMTECLEGEASSTLFLVVGWSTCNFQHLAWSGSSVKELMGTKANSVTVHFGTLHACLRGQVQVTVEDALMPRAGPVGGWTTGTVA